MHSNFDSVTAVFILCKDLGNDVATAPELSYTNYATTASSYTTYVRTVVQFFCSDNTVMYICHVMDTPATT